MYSTAILATLLPLASALNLFHLPGTSTTGSSSTVKRDSWGGALSLGPTTSHILSATTTLIPGTAPATQAGELFLWPGMSNGTGDLIQTTLESWPDNSWCGAASGEWCVRASLFGSFGQLDGTASPVPGDMNVFINYTRNADGINWTQLVSDATTGSALSNFTHESGPMTGWGTGTECDSGCTGTIAEQTYKNVVITLASSDTSFLNTLTTSGGVTYTNAKMSSDGTVLTIDEILVPSMS
ncbi:hypothetical protein BP6252_09013 [Coleophoma cylindrospora]|uniref:Uncharacterized protein n=1 Tax=Coleophoma cylindrospora TaxID=1849047 RepID=A0A3D8R0Q1_9HELO|nr:hypothetical protein BP6252_09013 [Coleophoma cylindrospora]